MSYLVLVRHGESEYNARGLWTGLTDIPLNQKGIEEAKEAGKSLKNIKFDVAFTSSLLRSQQTLSEILKALPRRSSLILRSFSEGGSEGGPNLPIHKSPALNERNYGDYTGKNKWEIKEKVGEEEFQKIRRSWDFPIPNGESLKDVYNRVVPYFEQNILPHLKQHKNVLITAHGNSLRALIKHLENIPDDAVSHLEIGTGEVYVYKTDENGKITSKETRSTNPLRGKQ
ncbi:MAG: 2,3-diphosphoglycerate-dependent phosphoglycerate mutase [Armatimonadetes bacterium]|nr:MAG: 2,3-diphosphoglycerate-dependent phosphoglycerate mutase [Armatimonadota bacterium]